MDVAGYVFLGFVCLLRGLYGTVVWVVSHGCAVADAQVYFIAVAIHLLHFEMVLKLTRWLVRHALESRVSDGNSSAQARGS